MSASLPVLLRALSDRARLRLLSLLGPGEACVCDLSGALGVPQPKVSRHLAVLLRAGLVRCRRDGRWAHYSAAPAASAPERRLVAAARGCWDRTPTARGDRRRL